MGGSFRRGLHSEVVTFSTRLAVQPSPLYKSNGAKSNMAASYFRILPSDWPKLVYSSIQVQLYDIYSSPNLHSLSKIGLLFLELLTLIKQFYVPSKYQCNLVHWHWNTHRIDTSFMYVTSSPTVQDILLGPIVPNNQEQYTDYFCKQKSIKTNQNGLPLPWKCLIVGHPKDVTDGRKL